MHTEGFAAAEATSKSSNENVETVTLTETTTVCKVLLQYIYHHRNPIYRMSTSKLWQGGRGGREVSGPLGYLHLQGPYGVCASRENKDGEWTI